jgi:hypothetical protein
VTHQDRVPVAARGTIAVLVSPCAICNVLQYLISGLVRQQTIRAILSRTRTVCEMHTCLCRLLRRRFSIESISFKSYRGMASST